MATLCLCWCNRIHVGRFRCRQKHHDLTQWPKRTSDHLTLKSTIRPLCQLTSPLTSRYIIGIRFWYRWPSFLFHSLPSSRTCSGLSDQAYHVFNQLSSLNRGSIFIPVYLWGFETGIAADRRNATKCQLCDRFQSVCWSWMRRLHWLLRIE